MDELRFRIRLQFRRRPYGEFAIRRDMPRAWLSKRLSRSGLVLWMAATAGVIYAINQGAYHLPVSPVPVCSLVATPTTIDPGQEVNLRWTAENGTDFEIQPDLGKVRASGAKTVKPTKSVTYILVAKGDTGAEKCKADISVNLPSCALTADRTAIDEGQSATLSWIAKYATDYILQPDVGKVDAASSRTVTPSETTNYSLTVTGPSGTNHCDISITVANLCAQIEDAFFEVKTSTLRPQDRQTLLADAEFLKAHPELMVTIEGHADERGTPDQNFGLSKRRAENVKAFLVAKGVPRDRITTVPHSDRSDCMEHDDICWQKNRRARFVCRSK